MENATAIIRRIGLLTILALSLQFGYSQKCDTVQLNFSPGEELIYEVYYNWRFVWIPAGEGMISLREEDNQYVGEIVGANYPSYENLFRVRDKLQSRMDKHTLMPREFLRTIEEGNYRKYDSLYFDRDLNIVAKLQGKNQDEAEWTEDEINPCVHDLISMMYTLRSIDISEMKNGEKIELEMYFDDKAYPITLKIGKRKTKEIKNLGDVKVRLITPAVIAGTVFKEGTEMKLWVSDDKNQIPLLVEAPLKVGSAKVILKSHKGVKYPVTY